MPLLNSSDALLAAVKEGIRDTVSALRKAHPRATLAGYALLTDDGLSTLVYRAVTAEALEASSDADLLFSPTDWPYDPMCSAFDAAGELLRARATQTATLRDHVDAAFEVLVEALAQSKTDHVLGPDVFLSALSTDPSDHLEVLEASSISRLNDAAITRRREDFLTKWASEQARR
jgi:hypothetical protein